MLAAAAFLASDNLSADVRSPTSQPAADSVDTVVLPLQLVIILLRLLPKVEPPTRGRRRACVSLKMRL